MTAPLDLLWEQYRSLGAAQPADFEAFLVAEVERLGQERDAARNALAMIEGADLGEIDVKLIARQARALHSRAPAAPPDEIAHGLRGHMCSVCRGVIPHGEVAAFADGGRGPARHLGCAPSALPGEGGTTEGQANG